MEKLLRSCLEDLDLIVLQSPQPCPGARETDVPLAT